MPQASCPLFFCISPGMGKKGKLGWMQMSFKNKRNLSEIVS
jgi:hypothetical protein